MKIGVIGSGVVGKTLAAGFLKHGHAVTIGTRDVGKLKDWAGQHKSAKVAGFAETAAFGEVVVLAVAGGAALDALKLIGAANVDGKPVIDATNPIGGGPPVHGVLSFFTSLTDSLMERLQKAYPKARFVKAFNSVGARRWSIRNSPAASRRCSSAARRRRQDDGRQTRRRLRLGGRRHGRGRGGAGDRALVHVVVHPRRRPRRLVAPRVQAAALRRTCAVFAPPVG